ncbi:hypothetical protein ACOSQ3_024711 [Xanthoceras sorbifolium]
MFPLFLQFFEVGHWLTPRGHLTCAIGGWVVSELFDIVHSLRPPSFCYMNFMVKESVWGLRVVCSLNLFWVVQIGFSFVDILTVGKHHALSTPDIQNWWPKRCLCIKNMWLVPKSSRLFQIFLQWRLD